MSYPRIDIFLVGLLLFCITGCSNIGITSSPIPTDGYFFPYYSDISFHDVNQSIKLSVISSETDVRVNYSIKLLVENRSNAPIKFPLDWGERIYQYWEQDGGWYEVKNRIIYSGNAVTLYPLGDNRGLNMSIIGVLPTLDRVEGLQLRVIVSGHSDITNEPVLAYIDLVLQP